MRKEKLIRGTQIIYIPTHCQGNEDHPDVEEGFVTSVVKNAAFCRYWSKHYPDALRTKANSEGTPLDMLVIKNTHPQSEVEDMLEEFCQL